jgi:hypothetical protein
MRETVYCRRIQEARQATPLSRLEKILLDKRMCQRLLSKFRNYFECGVKVFNRDPQICGVAQNDANVDSAKFLAATPSPLYPGRNNRGALPCTGIPF